MGRCNERMIVDMGPSGLGGGLLGALVGGLWVGGADLGFLASLWDHEHQRRLEELLPVRVRAAREGGCGADLLRNLPRRRRRDWLGVGAVHLCK